MYGATTGDSGRLVPRLARAFPKAMRLVDAAARDWGRFTRNFVVQGSAAEWALCWMADLRTKLHRLGEPDAVAGTAATSRPAEASGPVFRSAPHLVYFLHDEIIVHTPKALAGEVADAVRESAVTAGRLLFGSFPVEFPLDLETVDSYGQVDP